MYLLLHLLLSLFYVPLYLSPNYNIKNKNKNKSLYWNATHAHSEILENTEQHHRENHVTNNSIIQKCEYPGSPSRLCVCLYV